MGYDCCEFRRIVTSISDGAMQDLGTSWRDPYYAMVLDKFLAMRFETQNWRSSTSLSDANVLETNKPKHKDNHRPMSPTFINGPSRGPSSGSTTTTSTSPESKDLEQFDGDRHSPANTSLTSTSSGLEAEISNRSSNLLCCSYPDCKAEFTGKSRKENLTRHLRGPKHNVDGALPCPKPGCGRLLSRSDNLRNHLQCVHGELPTKGRSKRDTDCSDGNGHVADHSSWLLG